MSPGNSRLFGQLSVTLQVLPSAEKGDDLRLRPHAAASGSAQEPLTLYCICLKCSGLFLWCAPSTLYSRSGRHTTIFSAGMADSSSLWCVCCLELCFPEETLLQRCCFGWQVFLCFPTHTSNGMAIIQKHLAKIFFLTLIHSLGKPKSTLMLSGLFRVRYLWCALCLMQW